MQTSDDFVRAIRARYGDVTDYRLAKLLGITQQAISHNKRRGSIFSDSTGCRIAELLDLDPGYVLACLAVERSKIAHVRQAWERVARSLAAGTAAAFAVVLITGAALDALPGAFASGGLCIMSNALRDWLRRRFAGSRHPRALFPQPS